MSDPSAPPSRTVVGEKRSTGELVGQVSAQSVQLARDEVRLAQLEIQEKAKALGVGVGMFGAAGVVALYGLAVLVFTAVVALALVVATWLAGLIVAVVLFAVAGVAALVGKRRTAEATPPVPTEAIDSVKKDVAAVKEARS